MRGAKAGVSWSDGGVEEWNKEISAPRTATEKTEKELEEREREIERDERENKHERDCQAYCVHRTRRWRSE